MHSSISSWSFNNGRSSPQSSSEIVRVAHNCDCEYEWGHHERLGRRAGLGDEEIARVREGAAEPGWSGRQTLLLRAADEMHEGGRIGTDLWAELAREYDEVLLIELCMLIGHYEMLAMTLNTLEVEPDQEARL